MHKGVIQNQLNQHANVFGNCSCHIAKLKLICLIKSVGLQSACEKKKKATVEIFVKENKCVPGKINITFYIQGKQQPFFYTCGKSVKCFKGGGKEKKIWAKLILLSQGVLDHTGFSFFRVERDEVTHCASVLPLYQPKISLPPKKKCQVPSCLYTKLSVMS